MSMTLAQLLEGGRQRNLAAPPMLDSGVVVGDLSAQQTVAVNCSGATEIAIVPVDLGVVLGDIVVLGHVNGKPIVLARLTGTALPPKPPLQRPTIGLSTFPATDARSWRGGAWRVDTASVVQSDLPSSPGGANTGAWFYGRGPASALAGATVTQARVRMRRRSGGSTSTQTANTYPHSSDARPVGNVVRVGTDGPATASVVLGLATWAVLPVSWGQRIVDTGGGLYVAGGDYVVLDGLDTDPQSGLLELAWSR